MIDFNIYNYLRISWQDVLLVCISSAIIVVVCKHFFWNNLLEFVAKRQKLIQTNIDESVQAKEDALKEKAEYQARIKNASAEAAGIIENAKKQAGLERQEIVAQAQREAEHIQASAKQQIARERLKAQNEMKAAITDVALAAAGQILQEEMDESRQKKIVDDFLKESGEHHEE